MKLFLTVKEVAAFLSVNEQYVLSLFEKEELRAYGFGEAVPLVSRSELQAFLDHHTQVLHSETEECEKKRKEEEL